MKLKKDESKSTRIELKKVLKGRPLYFALMAPGSKRGKFRLSKRKSDVKPADFKKNYSPYEDDKDNNLKGAACQGVVTGDKGVLTLHLDGKAPGSALRFLDHFILREMKFKQVRDIRIAETDQLPAVPDEDPLDGPIDAGAIQQRLSELQQQLDTYDGDNKVDIGQALATVELQLNSGDLENAENSLDEAESLFVTSEHLASFSDAAPDMSEIVKQLKAAQEKTQFLPAGLLSDIAQQISAAQKLIDTEQAEEARDAVSELDEAIDGAFQNFFIGNLKALLPAEDTLPPDVQKELTNMKKLVRRRDWTAAMTHFESLKTLLAATKMPATDDEAPAPVPLTPEAAAEIHEKTWSLLDGTTLGRGTAAAMATRIAQGGTQEDAINSLKEIAAAAKELEPETEDVDLIDLSDNAVELLQATKRWESTVDRLFDVMLNLANELYRQKDEDSVAVGEKIEGMINEFPPALADLLPSLEQAVRTGKTTAVETFRKYVLLEIGAVTSYLKTNRTYLTACENNPFGVAVDIEKPLNDTLKVVATCLQSV